MDMNLGKLRDIVKDRGAWCAAVHGIVKSWTRLGNRTTTAKKVTVRTRSLFGCFQNGPLACHQRSDSAEGQTYSVETQSSRGTEVSQDSLESWMRKLDLEA